MADGGLVAERSFRLVVAGVAASVMAVVVASLLLPVATNRNNDGENPPKYDCGNPMSYISGTARRPWRIADSVVVPTTAPGATPASTTVPDFRKSEVCQRAMAPRLGFTTWVLMLGFVVVVIVALAVPAAAAADARHDP